MIEILDHPIIYIQPRHPFSRQDEQVYSLLSDILGPDLIIAHEDSGAPVLLSHPPLAISISHCLSAIAIALAPRGVNVGVDVEDKVHQADRTLDRYASPEERHILEHTGTSPILLWSGKETVYKAYSPVVLRFTKDITLMEANTEEQVLIYSLHPDDRKPCPGIRVGWLSKQQENGKLGSDYEESLVLTYHFSEGMDHLEVISLTI